MLKDIPQDLLTIWHQRVSIIPEGICEILKICMHSFLCQIERTSDHALFLGKHWYF